MGSFPETYPKNLPFLKSGEIGSCIWGHLWAIIIRLSRFLARFLQYIALN